MGIPSTHNAPPRTDAPTDAEGAAAADATGAPFAATLTLTITLALAAVAVLLSAILLRAHPDATVFANAFGAQNQTAKTAVYAITFAVVLPAAALVVPRLADAIAARPNRAALPVLSAVLAGGLAAAILATKLSAHLPWGDGLGTLLAAVGIWWAGAAAALAIAARRRVWPPLLRMAGGTYVAALVAGALVLATLVCTTKLSAVTPLPLALGALAAAGILLAYERRALPRPARRWRIAIDAAIVLLLLLAIPELVVYEPTHLVPTPLFPPGVIAWHHDFLLGPTNQLLGGGALMVDAPISQYGVGYIYFLAGVFEFIPIGYGTYALLDGVLTALSFVAGYAVLRIAGVSRLLAGGALAVAVVALPYNYDYTVGALPEQGPLRFGLPLVVILALLVGERWPATTPWARAAAFAALGVSSIWAFESFAYTAGTFVAAIAVEAWLRPAGDRLRQVARQVVLAVAACVCVHLILAGATLAGTGHLPRWGQYLGILRDFLGGNAGEITYGFQPWSPVLAVAGGYLASAAAIVMLIRRAPATARRERVMLIALTTTTAYAIVLFSYADNRSSTSTSRYVMLPVALLAALWLGLLLRSRGLAPPRVRAAGLGFALAGALLLVAVAWPRTGDRLSSSALGHAYPGGGMGGAVRRLWHSPPIDPRAPVGQQLLDRFQPAEKKVVILLPDGPDLATEILMRSGRSNKLPIGDPKADSYVPSLRIPDLRRAVAKLQPGQIVLMNQTAQQVVATLRANPSVDPLNPLSPNRTIFGRWGIENWVLQRIDQRFELRSVYTDPATGFVVAQLVPRA
jgi:hypothetical protein